VGGLAHALAAQRSQFTAYVTSFYVVAQFWFAHHRVFRMVRGHDEGLAWWNFGFLFTITLMPFTSELLGRQKGNSLAVSVFAANLLLLLVVPRCVTAVRSWRVRRAGRPAGS